MKPTLFHGTNLRIASLSAQERFAYKDACLLTAKHFWQFFEEYSNFESPLIFYKLDTLKKKLPQESIPNLYANLLDKITLYKAFLNGRQRYQYDKEVTYVCTGQIAAQRYAYRSFAGGEMGLIVFSMLEACKAMGIKYENTDSVTLNSIKKVEEFAASAPQPAIIPITEYDMELLSFEDGKSIPSNMFEMLFEAGTSVSLKYCGNIKLDLSKAIQL